MDKGLQKGSVTYCGSAAFRAVSLWLTGNALPCEAMPPFSGQQQQPTIEAQPPAIGPTQVSQRLTARKAAKPGISV